MTKKYNVIHPSKNGTSVGPTGSFGQTNFGPIQIPNDEEMVDPTYLSNGIIVGLKYNGPTCILHTHPIKEKHDRPTQLYKEEMQ